MSKKHYILTSITLGAIAACSAGLISVTNLVTRNQIALNEKNKTMSGIVSLFGESSSIKKESEISGYKYTNYVYEISNGESTDKYAFRTTGSNSYGKISLLVGISDSLVMDADIHELVFTNVYIITNEQSFASTLVDNYIDPLNEGSRDLDDVSCSATYGAKLVREMVNEAKTVAKEMYGKGK